MSNSKPNVGLCEAQLQAILVINEANQQREIEYEEKLAQFQKDYEQWEAAHEAWEYRKNTDTKIIGYGSSWIEDGGVGVNCSTLSNDSFKCCRDHSRDRIKCTLQGKGGGSKCSNGGACTWFNRGNVCCSGTCGSMDPSYCTNAPVSNLPLTESKWYKNTSYPEPKKPIFRERLVFEQYPAIICQDCSTSIEALKSTDISFEAIEQATQCINKLEVQEVQESDSGNGEGAEITPVPTPKPQPNGNGNENKNGNIENTNEIPSQISSNMVLLIIAIVVILIIVLLYMLSG